MATTVYRYFDSVIEQIAPPDASILYGDVAFSTFRAFGSFIPWWPLHIERLKRGASFLSTDLNWNLLKQSLEDGKSTLTQHFQAQEWMGRPTLRRTGVTVELIFFAWELPTLQATEQNLAVALSERKRLWPGDIKGGDYQIENLGQQWAIESGMDDVLFWQGPNKQISETSRSNIFFINAREEIVTPQLDGSCLAGICREQVIALAKRLELQLSERAICLKEVEQMTEVFLTNCGQLIRPVGRINDLFFSSAHDNSLTNKLRKELNFISKTNLK
ncbi:MAG: hypothetical protein A2X86_07810 [Bdellovibrionales bacterium GWA2_49_15]|nr:MAG: hypothetical protein A2X86_07810 [Bdellovibrionales bacterium GWA2_49_15]HAZ11816.1 hypothetical protein [Bdellovibrionales bacterium]